MDEWKTPRIVCFGEFEADLRSRELRRGGEKVRLSGQPFEILALLLEHPGEVVTREELKTKLWTDETFVDFDHGLNAAVNKLREALGDPADAQCYVETLPRRGYRFIVPPERHAALRVISPSKVAVSEPLTLAKVRGRLTRLVMVLPTSAPLVLGPRPALAISPDGRHLVYVAGRADTTQLYLRAMDRLEPVPLIGTEGGTGPFFCPDGHWVGFFSEGKLKIVSLGGGAPLALCEAPESRGASWGPKDIIVFAPSQASGLCCISAAGGRPRVTHAL